ncbi:hypothetical protein VPH35_135980 [Triticum aestivum]
MLRLVRWSCRGFCRQPAEVRSGTPTRQRRTRGYNSCLGTRKSGLLDWGVCYFLKLLPSSIKRPRQVVVPSRSPFGILCETS